MEAKPDLPVLPKSTRGVSALSSMEILQRLFSSVREKKQELRQGNSSLLHHDNVPADNTLSIRQIMVRQSRLKGVIQRTRIEDVGDEKKDATTELQRILEESPQEYMQAWQRRMWKCIRLRGYTLKGENS
nr:uncharacterized protein LOC113811737 [Penaeus vannamei]